MRRTKRTDSSIFCAWLENVYEKDNSAPGVHSERSVYPRLDMNA
jgi:hypothetical protein